tara:strand:+ start:779 stop:1258 length:480 start_codon:yes stop_codon:yes gene_type:complete
MVSSRLIVVFVLPVIFSIIVGSIVMYDTLQKPDRELNMWPMSSSHESSSHESSSHESTLQIIGLSSQYLISEPIEVQVKVNDSSFSCGDLYLTIYPSGKSDAVAQGGFFNQCFKDGSYLLPIDDKFSKIIDVPGSYKLTAEMISKDLLNISTTGIFTIK